MSKISGELWTIRAHSGQEYTAIGYETRGIISVPIADIIDNICIQAEIYEIIHGMMPKDWNVSITRPNDKELELLRKAGWKYDGAFASYAG